MPEPHVRLDEFDEWLAARVKEAQARALERIGRLLTAAIKKKLSAPAPRKKIVSPKGHIYYRATLAATAGAPPRKLTGRLRASIAFEKIDFESIRVGTNLVYAARHEYGNHPFLNVTIEENQEKINAIVAEEIAKAISGG
jgi:phage gpG-like protein